MGSSLVYCQIDPIVITGLPDGLDEASGIQKTSDNSYWSHNDTDNDPRLYNINSSASLLEEIDLQGVIPVDFEDVAYDGVIHFYVGDFGNNLNNRQDLIIYRIPNPDLLSSNIIPESIEFTLEDQSQFPPGENNRNFDIEAMFFFDKFLHLFTRNRTNPFDGFIKHYRLNPTPGQQVAELVNTIFGNLSPNHSSITSADINPSGNRVVLLTNSSIFIIRNFSGDDFLGGEIEYNFFNSTLSREGVSFKDECEVLIVLEEDDLGMNNNLESFNTCDVVSSVQENQYNISISSGEGYVKLTSPNYDLIEIEVFNALGQRIDQLEFLGEDNNLIDTQLWNHGIYIINAIFIDRQRKTFKVIR